MHTVFREHPLDTVSSRCQPAVSRVDVEHDLPGVRLPPDEGHISDALGLEDLPQVVDGHCGPRDFRAHHRVAELLFRNRVLACARAELIFGPHGGEHLIYRDCLRHLSHILEERGWRRFKDLRPWGFSVLKTSCSNTSSFLKPVPRALRYLIGWSLYIGCGPGARCGDGRCRSGDSGLSSPGSNARRSASRRSRCILRAAPR